MPQIYITEETRKLLDEVSQLEVRTLDGEVNYLCHRRIKELSDPSNGLSSVNNENTTRLESQTQEK